MKHIFENLKMENEKDTLVKIGKKLKELRVKKGFKSYETFAWSNELPRVQYWRMEKGNTNFTIRSLVRVLKIHGISLKKFFAEI